MFKKKKKRMHGTRRILPGQRVSAFTFGVFHLPSMYGAGGLTDHGTLVATDKLALKGSLPLPKLQTEVEGGLFDPHSQTVCRGRERF